MAIVAKIPNSYNVKLNTVNIACLNVFKQLSYKTQGDARDVRKT